MSKEHAAKLTTEIKSDMTIEERFDYQVEHTSELTPEQLEKLRNNRHVNRLFETEGRHRNLQGKYETWPLPGKTNDDRWLCLKACFDNDRPDLNWLIGSTSGIHGSYTTLNDLENPESEYHQDMKAEGETYEQVIGNLEAFTILIIQPRVCRIIYGTIGIRSKEDFHWLRNKIDESVHEIRKSQEGNTHDIPFK